MRVKVAAAITAVGLMLTIVGGVSLYRLGLYADATGTSGGNPSFWITFFVGMALTGIGAAYLLYRLLGMTEPTTRDETP